MPDEEKRIDGNSEKQNIRLDMVNTAVNFLLNPGVINKPYAHKTAFLRKKGLSEAEISLAYKRAESDPKHDEILKNSIVSNNSLALPPPMPIYRQPVSFWSRISRFSSQLIVLGVALYGAHYIYKMYIQPLIFGKDHEGKKSVRLEKQLLDVVNSLSELEKRIESLDENVKCQKGQLDKYFQNEVREYYPTPLALQELKSDIASVKSLLLNRHQFPALPKVTPTIPQWQLPSKENSVDSVNQNGEISEHQYSDEHKSSGSKSPCESNSEEEKDQEEENDPREENNSEEENNLEEK